MDKHKKQKYKICIQDNGNSEGAISSGSSGDGLAGRCRGGRDEDAKQLLKKTKIVKTPYL